MSAIVFLCSLVACAQQDSLSALTWRDLLHQADSLKKITQYDSAEVLAKEALAIVERDYGSQDTTVAKVLNQLGAIYCLWSKYPDAERTWNRALDIRVTMLGAGHADVASSLSNLGLLYRLEGRYPDAEKALTRVVSIREQLFGTEDLSVAKGLSILGVLYDKMGRYSDAETCLKRSLAIHEKAFGPDHIEVARSVSELASLYNDAGRYVESEALFKRALAILERLPDPEPVAVAVALGNLAILLSKEARYGEAEEDFQRSLELLEQNLGERDPQVATCLNNLGLLYGLLGRLSEAESLTNRALQIWTEALGPDHPSVAKALNSLGNLSQDAGRYSEAESYYRRALDTKARTVGTERADYAACLANLGHVYVREKKLDSAEVNIRQAYAVMEKSLGDTNAETGNYLSDVGSVLLRQNRFVEAQDAFRRAQSILEKNLGKTHPDVAHVLNDLAMIAARQGDFSKAREYEARAFSIRRKNFSEGFAAMSERDALDYSVYFRREAAHYLSLLLDMPNGPKTNRNEIAKVVLSTKGQVSDGIFARHKATMSIASLVDSVNAASRDISELYVKGADPARQWAFDTDMARATRRKDQLETELAQRTGEIRNEKLMAEADAAKLAGQLPAKSALIEFMRYEHDTAYDETESRYLALVIRSGGKVSVFPLGSAAAIDAAVEKYRRYFKDPTSSSLSRENYWAASEELRWLVWQPIVPALSSLEKLYIAPDGALGLVSFAGLFDEDGSYLIEKYSFQYLLSGRDLLQHGLSASGTRGLLAMGDPDYDASPESRATGESNRVLAGIKGVFASMTTRNVMSGCRALRDTHVEPLPGTRREVEQLASRWRGASAEPAATYFDVKATEDRLKSDSHGKRVIHLATHGYYVDEACRPSLQGGSGYVGENALLQSGLFFAGANLMGKGASEAGLDDGIVTAEEVANLNLQGTDLVILSACETGVGQVRSGEGVFGLRRAFQMAGARTVISALWSVDDESTSEMIGQIFSGKGTSVADEMRRAALNRLAVLRNAGRSDDPFYWAAFVATGD